MYTTEEKERILARRSQEGNTELQEEYRKWWSCGGGPEGGYCPFVLLVHAAADEEILGWWKERKMKGKVSSRQR